MSMTLIARSYLIQVCAVTRRKRSKAPVQFLRLHTQSPALGLTMTLEEDEDLDLHPASLGLGHQAAGMQRILTRCAEIAAIVPLILLLLPVYLLVQVGGAAIRLHRLVRRPLHRCVFVSRARSAFRNLKLGQIADLIATTGIAAPKH